LCPDYTKCLNRAVEQKLKTWTCEGCKKQNEPGYIKATDFTPEYLLLIAIFNEDLYRAYRAVEKYKGESKRG